MNLLNEEKLAQFIKKTVISMELKINIPAKFMKMMIRLSGREWLNVQDSAFYMGISDTTFRKWRKEYKIPSRTIEGVTRWKKSDLDEFWKNRGIKGYL